MKKSKSTMLQQVRILGPISFMIPFIYIVMCNTINDKYAPPEPEYNIWISATFALVEMVNALNIVRLLEIKKETNKSVVLSLFLTIISIFITFIIYGLVLYSANY